MKNRLFPTVMALVFLAKSLFAVTWDTGLIPLPPSASIGATKNVIVAPGPNEGNAVAVWADELTQAPYYSIYSNGTWTTGPIPLNGSAGSTYDVYVTEGPNDGEVVATWVDSSNTALLYYSLYTGGSWTTGLIPIGSSIGSNFNVTVTPGPASGEVTALWPNFGNKHPFYSIYSGGTWSNGAELSSVAADNNVFGAPGVIPGTLVATWVNSGANYSVYSAGTWSAAATIPLGSSSGVFLDVVPATNPVNEQVAAVWANGSDAIVYYSFYDGSSWTPGAPIPGPSAGAFNNPYITAELTGELVVTWADELTQFPYFSIYQNGAWSDGAPIPLSTSSGSNFDVTIAHLAGVNTMIAAWGNLAFPHVPYYSSFIGAPLPPPPVTEPLPPTNGQGSHITNRFALLTEWTNQLSWTASISPDVTGYNISRNGVLIATNVAGTTYSDSNVPQKGTIIYRITSVNGEGQESTTALEITVTGS